MGSCPGTDIDPPKSESVCSWKLKILFFAGNVIYDEPISTIFIITCLYR